MEQIFPNLYRFEGESSRKEKLYTFLIVREDGNLLLPAQAGPVTDHFDEIEELGGVDTQFVTHNHDVDGPLHEAVNDRFGAKLSYHCAEHDAVTEKADCPAVEFGDEGLQLDSDFRAIYFPSCCAGSSVYHWQSEGKGYLFTSHVINMVEGEWRLGLDLWQYANLRDWGDRETPPDPRPRIAEIAQLPIDYTLPNVWKEGQEEVFHQFDDRTRKSFSEALGAAIRRESGNLLAT